MKIFDPAKTTRAELDQLTTDWRTARTERLELQRMVDKVQELETQLNNSIIEVCTTQHMEGVVVGGRITRVTTKQTPICNDRAALSAFILEHQALDLLQFRLSTKAAKLRLDDGIVLPGVVLMDKLELSDTKL
jgi:hypothetical protein